MYLTHVLTKEVETRKNFLHLCLDLCQKPSILFYLMVDGRSDRQGAASVMAFMAIRYPV
jgi:hypothetical protein